MTTQEQVQAILATPRADGARWKKKDLAEMIGRHPRCITDILKGGKPINPNVAKMIDRLYASVVNGVVFGESYIII